jgi:6-phosphogluconolactonase
MSDQLCKTNLSVTLKVLESTNIIVAFVLAACFGSTFSFGQNNNFYLYVGTYTQSTSVGIYIYKFNSGTGDIEPVGTMKGSNPSFLAISSDQQFLFSLSGNNRDSVKAYSIERPSHQLKFINAQSLAGSYGSCHLSIDQTGRWLIVGNYLSGSVCVLPIRSNGMLDSVSQTIIHQGKSIDTVRQQSPHVHSINIAPNNKDVFVPDLGTDKIMTYNLNSETGQLTSAPLPFTSVSPGSGPRHFVFHPNGKFAYVIQEMSATTTGFSYKDGALKSFQTVENLPPDYKGRKWAADIHISPDGNFLYGSNRSHESLVIFSIDKKSGKLNFVGHESVNGKTPRNFCIDPTGNFILVANQDSDNISIFKRDQTTGKLTYANKEIKVPQPVCLKFAP